MHALQGKLLEKRCIMEDAMRVLYVDDDPDLLELGKMFLEEPGDFSVITINSALSALTLLNEEKFDAIISDYQMPVMDGLQFLIEARTRFGKIPFILFTGKGREEVVIQAINHGVDFYLQKGGDTKAQFAELIQKIRQAVQRHKAETDLVKSEANLQAIIANTNDIIALYDPKVRLQVYNHAASETYRSLFGIELCPGLCTLDLFPELMRGFWNANNARALAGESFLIEFNLPMLRGEVRFFESSYNPIRRDGIVVGFSTFTRDITERKRIEETLAKSEEKFRAIANYTVNWESWFGPEGEYIWVSPSVLQFTGYSQGEIQAMSDFISTLIAEKDRIMFTERFRKAIGGASGENFEFRYLHRNGTKKWLNVSWQPIVDINGNFIGTRSSGHDITEKKCAEENLISTLKRTQDQQAVMAMISLSPLLFSGDVDALSVMLTQESSGVLGVERVSVWLFNNKEDELRCIDLFERSQDRHSRDLVLKRHEYVNEFEALSTENFIDANDPLTDPRTAGYVEGYLKPNRITSMLDAVIRVSGKNLGVICFEHVDRPHHWASDEIAFACHLSDQIAIALLNRDRKRVEEALHQANKKLNLLSGITRHDINNQLTALQGYLSIFEKWQLDSTYSDYLKKAKRTAERISAMIRFTKEYEGIGVHAPGWHNVRTLVDNAAKEIRLGQVKVKNVIPADTEVFADPLVVKVFYNLMDNAVRYGGKITTIQFFVQESRDNHLIVCEDDGEGVLLDEKEKIFERGFGKNTGLGLALSREVLDITGITIHENGEPGKGARFAITVPTGKWQLLGSKEN